LDIQSLEEALRRSIDSVREAPAVRRRGDVSYALVVKVGYEEIQKLRSDGYSYDVICETLSRNGVLDTGASPKNLCSAFLRETKRRLKRQQTPGHNIDASMKTDAGTTPVAPDTNGVRTGEKVAEKESEKARIRRLTGTIVNTGLGEIVKHTDGSFDL